MRAAVFLHQLAAVANYLIHLADVHTVGSEDISVFLIALRSDHRNALPLGTSSREPHPRWP
jgi:hypothetical protein